MAPMSDQALARRGRRAYELGRARWASRVLGPIAFLLAVAHVIGRPTPLVLGLGTVLAAGGFALAMVHDRYARALRTGLLSGLPAFLLPLIIRSLDLLPVGGAVDPCVPASFVSGIAAGWIVSRRALDETHRLSFWAAAVATTAVTGTLGCSVAGGGGVLGMIAGVVAGSAPLVLRSALQRS